MAIRIEQPGAAKAAAQVGAIIGKGRRAEEERARAERQTARQAAQEWELQKMALNSQQDFAHEMRMRQAGLDAEARAREWQVEKMEIASRMDFEQEEKERLRIKAEYAAGRDTLDKKKEEMPAGEYERALFRLDSIYAPKGVDAAVEGLGFDIKAKDDIISQIKALQEEKISGEKTPRILPPTIAEVEQAAANREVFVRNKKTHTYGTISLDEARKVTPKDEWELVERPIVPPKHELSKEEKLELRGKMFGGFYF